jgi:mannonate dehydratase
MCENTNNIPNPNPNKKKSYKDDDLRIALVLTPLNDINLQLASQISVTDFVYYNMDTMPMTVEELQKIKDWVNSYGLKFSVIEGGPPMDKIVLAKPGRDEQLEVYKQCIRNMDKVGIPILCYNFMPWSLRVGRTSYETPIRGGALSSSFNWELFDDKSRTIDGDTTIQEMWNNLEYFLKEVIPVAEESGVYLAIHPDDPPIPKMKGLARIINTPEDIEKLLNLVPSKYNGLTFCQGTFSEMGVDIPSTIKRFANRIHFVHFRDVIGNKYHFVETFQDEGQTDMYEAMKTWRDIGFRGPIRPDHVPLLAGEEGHDIGLKAKGYFSGKASGYTMMGRLFAVGYMRGLIEAVMKEKKT